MNRYKFTTYEKNGQFVALGIAADLSHSFTVGTYQSRRLARLALEKLMSRDSSLEVVKRMNYRRELPQLSSVCDL